MKWEDDGSLSVKRLHDLNLEQDIPKKNKFQLRTVPNATEILES